MNSILTSSARAAGRAAAHPDPGATHGSSARVAVTAAVASLILASSCAPTLQTHKPSGAVVAEEARRQQELAMRSFASQQERLARVVSRIASSGGELCGEPGSDYGIWLHDIRSYRAAERETARRALGAGILITVRWVKPNGPAAKAGLLAGDTLKAIAGKPVARMTAAQATALLARGGGRAGAAVRSRASTGEEPLEITHLRRGKERTVRLTPETICNVPFALMRSDVVNAYADGHQVILTTGMMNFAESDEELALIVGHEISHNSLGHISKRRGNALLGSIVDLAVTIKTGHDTYGVGEGLGRMMFSRAFEAEGDYQGLYLVARAGYDIRKAPEFWRRFSEAHPATQKSNFFSSHPSNPERFVAMEMTVKEIERKQKAKLRLTPGRKAQAAAAESGR